MTREELKQEAEKQLDELDLIEFDFDDWSITDAFREGYLAGAEPREKRIEELEQKLEQTEKDLADYQFNYPTIKELQKENAELKDELKSLRESIKDYGAGCYENGLRNGKRKLEEQLTKAKELLKRCYENYIYLEPLRSEIEQFLNSEVEK